MKAEAHWRRLAVPGATSLAIVGIAPVLSELRGALAAVFPRSFVPLVSVGFVAVLAGAAVLAARHIRRRRLPRFLGLATAAGLVALQVLAFARDDAQVSAIERLHILEYGLLALLFYWALVRRHGPWTLLLAALATAFVGTVDELVQWWVPLRVGEMRDVLLNWTSACAGLVAAVSLWPPQQRSVAPAQTRKWIAVTGAVLALTVALFWDRVHTGHRIVDTAGGLILHSWTSADGLHAAAADRAARWRGEPPGPERPYSIQDRFLAEGRAHVARRNLHQERGRFGQALGEQRILERWYAPVLELRDATGEGTLYGYEDWKRRQLVADAGRRPAADPFESTVGLERLRPGPSATSAWLAGLTVAGLFLLPLLLRRRPT